MTPAQDDFRFSDLRRGVPLIGWLIVALHALVFASYAVLVPYYRSPDEIQHVDMAVHLAHSLDYPRPQQRQISLGVMNSTVEAGYGRVPTRSPTENRPLDAAAARPRRDRPSFDALGGDQPYVEGNQMGQHPPLYYAVAAVVLRVVPGSGHWPWDRVVHLLRLLSVLMVLPVPLLSFATARRLGGSVAVGVTASLFTLAVPEFAHVGSSVNNDNLLVLLMSAAITLVAYVATGDSSRRTALLIGGLGALALLTKGLVLFAPAWIVVVYGAVAWRRADSRFAWRGVVAAATAAALGGWWWLRNLAVYDAVQPRGLVGPPLATSPAQRYTLADKGVGWAERAATLLSNRFWVEFSVTRNCTGPPLRATCVANPAAAWIPAWTTVASVVALALIAVAFWTARRRGVLPLIAVSLPFAAAFAQLVVVDWLEFSHSGAPSGLQGRYFYLALVAVAALVALGAGALLPRHDRWLPLAMLACAAVLHARTIMTILDTHWGGAADGLRVAAANATAWSALPAGLVRLTWLCAAVLAVAVGVLGIRTVTRRQG
ncbi:MAG: hypothetical protein QOG49_1774 [Frankiaceae bacterium]|nr:hypothetical protein [Frankiaceae bacterium]